MRDPPRRESAVDGPRCAPRGEPNPPNVEQAAAAEPEESTPANAHWKAMQPELERYFGEARCRAWFDKLITTADNGEVLILGAH